jgi:hypothetical protein
MEENMPKKKKEETVEDILDRMENDIESIREKLDGQTDDDYDMEDEDDE